MRVFTGIQPSGALHFGNYFGMIHPLMELVAASERISCMIADLHALTTVQDADLLRRYRRGVALDLLACGFDTTKAILFFQSDVAEHAELMWILATVTPMGLLERAVSYKEKVEKGITATVGLFNYPVLQAADILLYDATLVPVGKDQKQHLEMARDIAMKFNHIYGETFVVPESLIREEVAVVPGTDGRKMSKSSDNTIPLFGSDTDMKKAIMGIVTDSKGASDPKDPATSVIYQIHKLFLSEVQARALAEDYRAGLSYGDAKKRLLQTYLAFIGPMRERRRALEGKGKEMDTILQDGATRARHIASKTIERVRRAVGLLQ